MSDDRKKHEEAALTSSAGSALEEEGDLPPIVARMVVEIRSDGSKTIARGALEDLQTGQKVALRADGSTPLALASQLSRSLLEMPGIARSVAGTAARQFSEAKMQQLKDKWGPWADRSPLAKLANKLTSSLEGKKRGDG